MNDLNKTIDEFKNQVFKSNFDISKDFLPDTEIIKNIIASKSTNLSKDDLNMIVDGKVKDKLSGIINDVKGVASKVYPLPMNNAYFQEAQNVKNEVRAAVAMIMKEKSSIAQELATATIAITNAVPAIVSLATTIPIPNINAAITLACSVISQIMKLTDKISDISMYIEPLKKLNLLISPDKLEIVTKPIKIAITTLTALLKPVMALKDSIQLLLGKITSSISPDKLKSQINRLRKQIKDKNIEIEVYKASLMNLISENDEIMNSLIDERNDMQEQLDKLINGDISRGANFDLIKKEIDNQIKVANDVVTTNYLYDVKLPDGTVLTNQTDEDLSKLTKNYKIVYQNG